MFWTNATIIYISAWKLQIFKKNVIGHCILYFSVIQQKIQEMQVLQKHYTSTAAAKTK